ncbi:MAG: sensor histidine kinase N-terminal domain-containing protein [Xylophilus ampelinus]
MKIFQRRHRSLFGEILDWMLTPLALLLPLSLGLTWLVAQGLANNPYDRALETSARTLARQVLAQYGEAPFRLDAPAPAAADLPGDAAREPLDALHDEDGYRVLFQVRDGAGDLRGGDPDLPLPDMDDWQQRPRRVYLRDEQWRGERVRIAYLWIDLPPPGGGAPHEALPEAAADAFPPSTLEQRLAETGVSQLQGWTAPDAAPPQQQRSRFLVQVAETRERRAMLATEIAKGVMIPQLAMLPLAILLIWLALARAIKPLHALEARIRARKPDDLSPLDDGEAPYEVEPLVSSVNDLLQRLGDSMATQKRFLADAAHQLKTPLAGLRMQADLAQREGASAEELKRSLQQIGRASVRATHAVNQLLSLARAEAGGVAIARRPCDLARLAMEAVREAVPRALDRRIDLGYEGAQPGSPGVTVPGNPTLLYEMVRNLLDNAIAYTPAAVAAARADGAVAAAGAADAPPLEPETDPGDAAAGGPPEATRTAGMVTVRVHVDAAAGRVVLQVEDTGPGIPPAERALVFQPFYRMLGNEADGSGLGLPIVQEIARQHGAVVTLEDARPGHVRLGVRVAVGFPLAEAPAAAEA